MTAVPEQGLVPRGVWSVAARWVWPAVPMLVVGGLAMSGEALAVGPAGTDPTAIVAAPWQPPGAGLPLGADGLGRDVFARTLAGGAEITGVAVVAALGAATVGVAGGLWTGWSRGRAARAAARLADLLLSLPLLLLCLLAVVALPTPAAVVAATVLGGAPLTVRTVADATAAARFTGYVEDALLRGEPPAVVLVREVLPAHAGLICADLAQRVVLALHLAATLNVLGFGPAPPAADWAAMLRENLPGLTLNPAAMLAPAAALAALAAAVALFAHVLGSGRAV